MDERYRVGLMDWRACASAGREQTAGTAARAAGGDLSDRVIAAGAAGHVLDFDDAYVPGLAHLTAPVAPAACLLGAEAGASIGDVIDAYAGGFEAMGAVARAGHPTLYDRGWHPTSVCGVVGSAVASAKLLGLSAARTQATECARGSKTRTGRRGSTPILPARRSRRTGSRPIHAVCKRTARSR